MCLRVAMEESPTVPKMIFVNLPVADVEASAAFYTSLGFTKNDRFSQPGSAAAIA